MSRDFDNLYELTCQGNRQNILTRVIAYVNRILEKDPTAIGHIMALLQNLGPDSIGLEQHASEQLEEVANALMQVLGKPESVDVLAKRITHPEQRALALTLLGWFGSNAAAVVPELVDRFGGGSHGVSAIARRSIVLIGGGEREILKAIHTSITNQDDGNFRELTHLALMANLGSSSRFVEIMPAVIHSNNPDLKEAAASFIGQLTPEIKGKLVYVLETLTNDPDPYVQQAALNALS